MESKKVIRIELKTQSVDGQNEFFFGSIAAVYDKLSAKHLGVTQKTMANYLWHRGGMYENELCKVTTGEIIRKGQKNP